jgi:NitT/TauT family transport system substrate-binding protein
MFRKYKYVLTLSIFCLAAFLFFTLTGCKAATPEKTIRFGYIAADQLHSPAVMVMKEKKLLEAAGFAVEWHEYLAGAHVMQDMALGAIDFASCGVVPIMISHSQGAKLAIIAGANQEGSSLVVADSITTIADLDGARIGTPGHGSIQDAMLAQLAKTYDIQIRRMAMEVADMPLFLKNGEIDGFIAWAPHPAKAVAQKYGHELLTSQNMMPGHQCCVLVTTESILDEDPETANKLLQVYLDAYKWFMDNQDESVKLLAKNTGIAEDIIRQALPTVNYSYPPYCNESSLQTMAQSLIETGRITLKEEDLEPFLESLYQPQLLSMANQ